MHRIAVVHKNVVVVDSQVCPSEKMDGQHNPHCRELVLVPLWGEASVCHHAGVGKVRGCNGHHHWPHP